MLGNENSTNLSISTLDFEHEDFFFKNKFLARKIMGYLNAKDLCLLSRTSKFFFFEINKEGVFSKKYEELCEGRLLLLSQEAAGVDLKDHKKLCSLFYQEKEKGEEGRVFSDLEEAINATEDGDLLIIPPKEFVFHTISVPSEITIVRKMSSISGVYFINFFDYFWLSGWS